MYKIGVCEDNPDHLDDLCQKVAALLPVSSGDIRQFSGAKQLLSHLESSNTALDILLLDISLGKDNGVALARKINGSMPNCQIIFVTGYLHLAPEAYDAEHVYLVMKPQLNQRLPAALERAVQLLERGQNDTLVIQNKGEQFVFPQKDILYLERNLRKTILYCRGQTGETYEPLEALLSRLNEEYFLRCHNSFVVNLAQVASYRRIQFTMKNGALVPISRRYMKTADDAFLAHLGKQADYRTGGTR